jgi:hypothetical protein
VSGGAQLRLQDSDLLDCVGGLWLWDRAAAHAVRTLISSEKSFAVLIDGAAHATSGGDTTVAGPVLLADLGAPSLGREGAAAAASLRAELPGAGAAAPAAKGTPAEAASVCSNVVSSGDEAAAPPATSRSSSASSSASVGGGTVRLVSAQQATVDLRVKAGAFPPETGPFTFQPPQYV